MLIQTYYNGVELHRKEKIIFAKFLVPHQVLSTCRAAGGLQTGLSYVFNRQSCEPTGHMQGLLKNIYRDPKAYRELLCKPYGLPPEQCATLGTAANMNHAALVSKVFRDLEVVAVCTGGVETNGGRVGDPASGYETSEGFKKLQPAVKEPGPGTINTMLFINKPLTPGAMTRVIMTATEAKTAALQELAVNSRYSDGLATGTGTDQIAVSAAEFDGPRLTSAGKHAKLGELIGKAVLAAVKETLGKQNNLTPRGQCSAKIHLERFGCSRKSMLDSICRYLADEPAGLLRQNFIAMERDPVTVAAVTAMVHLKDKFTWKILPESCWSEIMGAYGAQIACAVSGKYQQMEEYRRQLAPTRDQNSNNSFLNLVWRAMALGFTDKWPAGNGAEKIKELL